MALTYPIPAPLHPDAVAVINTYLNVALPANGRAVRAVSQIPTTRPVELVKVSRTGGTDGDLPMVDVAQLTFDCWGATPITAMSLAQLVRRLVQNLAGTVQSGVRVKRIETVGAPADLPDPVSNTPRVTFTSLVHLRGSAA